MRSNRFSMLTWAAVIMISAMSAFAQTTFSDPNVEYSFVVPDAKWKMTARPSSTNPNVEYVYGERRDGMFEVRRLTVAKNSLLTDTIRDEEQKLQFMQGYIAGKEENFNGKLKGSIFNFEYVYSGHAMAGRYYFLRPNETTVYVLRFSGPNDILRSIRNQTDQMARTFSVKAS